jgi:hypothetical protein
MASSKTGADEATNRKPRPDLATPYLAPRTEAEKLMANVWQEVLGYDSIGAEDDLLNSARTR